MNQWCEKCRDKQNINIEFTLTYLAFVQIGHVVSGHLLFDEEVLNLKITGIFRSPIALIALILSTLHDIESTSTSTDTESKFRKFFEHECYEDKTGRYHYFQHRIPVPVTFLNGKPTGIFWFDNKIWEQYEFEIDWDDGEFSTIFPTGPRWDSKTGPTWWRAGRHLDTSKDADEETKQLIHLIAGSNNKFLSPNH